MTKNSHKNYPTHTIKEGMIYILQFGVPIALGTTLGYNVGDHTGDVINQIGMTASQISSTFAGFSLGAMIGGGIHLGYAIVKKQ